LTFVAVFLEERAEALGQGAGPVTVALETIHGRGAEVIGIALRGETFLFKLSAGI
jgi:hypothetical protein